MATRFYLPASGTPPLASLAADSNWERTDGLTRLPCDIVKSNTSLTQVSATWPVTTSVQWVWRQWQSKRLAQAYNWTTSDTVSMVVKVAEAVAQCDSHLAYVIRVVSGDGSTVRGTVGLYHATSSEYPTSLAAIATRIHSARTGGASAFSSQVGDRIIIEIGHHGVTPAADIVYHNYGDPSATGDYALTAGLTTDLCPWVELSRDLDFNLEAAQDAYLTGNVFDKSSTLAFAQGSQNDLSSQDAYLEGSVAAQPASSFAPAYTKGQDSSLASQPAYLAGMADALADTPAYLSGQDSALGFSPAFTNGYLTGLASQPAYLGGKSLYALRPDGDVTAGGFQNELGGATLYASIDEQMPADTDYVWHSAPIVGSYCEVTLSNPGGDVPAGNHVIRWRARRLSGTLTTTMKCELRQGDTVIASDEQILSDNYQTFEKALTGGEIASITDYTDLRIRFTVTGLS